MIVSETQTALARERGLHLDTDLSPAPLVGDADRLTQVISNLVSNAIWYNRPDGRIRVATRADAYGVVLTVADTGNGIAAEDLPHVFERFHRADRARGRTEGHHGLGLAICRAVVDAHSGTLEVSSEPGTGTTFTVRLPAAAVPCGSPPGP